MDAHLHLRGSRVSQHVVQRFFDGEKEVAPHAHVTGQGRQVLFHIEPAADRGRLEKAFA